MVSKSILDNYYDFLLSEVKFGLPEHRDYGLLLDEMHRVAFTWSLDKDSNRDADAYELRKEFLFDYGYHRYNIWDTPRSVLEVLCAFSRRIEIEITGEPGNDDLSRWFWVRVENLGLNVFNDEHFDKQKVDDILQKWLERRYTKNGKGSIFPLTKSEVDQREVEMWYQMHGYLNENWSF